MGPTVNSVRGLFIYSNVRLYLSKAVLTARQCTLCQHKCKIEHIALASVGLNNQRIKSKCKKLQGLWPH